MTERSSQQAAPLTLAQQLLKDCDEADANYAQCGAKGSITTAYLRELVAASAQPLVGEREALAQEAKRLLAKLRDEDGCAASSDETGTSREALEWRKAAAQTEGALHVVIDALASAQPAAPEIPEGCTPADAMLLRKANHELAETEQRMRQALRFYAAEYHFHRHEPGAWDTVSGEPPNFYEDEANTATVEDGAVARMALRGDALDWGDDGPPPLCEGEPDQLIETGAQPAAPKGEALDALRLDWLQETQNTPWRITHMEWQPTTVGLYSREQVEVFEGWAAAPEYDKPYPTIREAIDAAMSQSLTPIPPDVAVEKKE